MDLIEDAQAYPVTTVLSVGGVSAYLAALSGRSLDHLTINPADPFAAPWTFITTIFPHGGLIHVAFNILWIWQLGRVIESRLGSPATGILAVLSAAFASGSQYLLGGAPIGLSGVVYAFAAFAWARGSFDPKFRGVIDEGTRNIFVGWFFICLLATNVMGVPVANGAHFGGAVIGLALGIRRQWIAPLLVALLGTAVIMRASVPQWDRTPAWERFSDEENYPGMEGALREIIRDNPDDSFAWWNLGVALAKQGKGLEAYAAMEKAADLDPGNHREELERIRNSNR